MQPLIPDISNKNSFKVKEQTLKKDLLPIPFPSSFKSKTDGKMLAHVAADFVAKGSGLEGHQLELTSKFLAEALKEIQESEGIELTECINAVQSLSEHSCQLAKLKGIEDIDERLKALDAFIEELIQKIQKLEPGEQLFIQGGWSSFPSGHAIVHIIEKESPDSYQLYTFNTGSGVNFYHLRHRDQEGMTHYKNVHLTLALDQENITNPSFYRSLFEMNVFPFGLEYMDKGCELDFIYGSILPILKGKEGDVPKWTKNFQNSQRAGICASKCLKAYLIFKLPEELYKKVIALTTYKTLASFLEATPYDQQTVNELVLVANIAEKQIRSLNKKKCAVQESQQREIFDKLVDIKKSALEQKLLWTRGAKKIKRELLFKPRGMTYAWFGYRAPNDAIVSTASTLSTELKFHKMASMPLLERKEITATNVSAELDIWGDYCEGLYKEESFLAARQAVCQIIKDLPIPRYNNKKGKVDPFWHGALNISNDEREQIIVKIGRLNDILYRCAFKQKSAGGDDLYCVMHSYAIQMQLMSSIIGFETYYDHGPIGGGGTNCGTYETQCNWVTESHLKYNSFAYDDMLRENFEHLGKMLSGGTSIREFIRNYGSYNHETSTSCKEEFREKLTSDLEKKGKLLCGKECLRHTGFKAALISDMGQRGLLPPFLASMNKQGFILYLFQIGNFFSKQGHVSSDVPLFEITFPTTETLIKQGGCGGYDSYVPFPDPEINGVGYLNTRLGASAPCENFLQSQIDNPAIKRIIEEHYDRSGGNGNIIVSSSLEHPDLQSIPYEELREIMLLTQTPLEMIIWQTLAYFSQYWDRLEDKNMQTFFDLLTTNHLKSEIDRSPSNLHVMLNFIDQGLQQFSPPEKLNGFLFCIDFGLKIHSRVKNEAFVEAFLNWETELRKRLDSSSYTSVQKQAVEVQLAHLMLQKPYSREQTAKILLASACQEATPMPHFLQGGELKRAFQDHLQRNRLEFMDALNQDPDFAANVMNRVTKTIFGCKESSWKLLNFPYFVDDLHTMTVNIMTGIAKCQNAAASPLPQSLLQNSVYKELFGTENFSARVDNFDLFTFTKDRLLYRIEFSETSFSSDLKIEVQIEGKWFRYLSKDIVKGIINLKPALKDGLTHWVGMESPREFLIKDASMETRYIGSIDSSRRPTGLSPVSNLELVHSSGSVDPLITNFEEDLYTLIWKDKAQKFKRLELPRLGLHFDFAEDKAYAQEFPGFYLTTNQDLDTLPSLRHFLILENDKDEKKVIFAKFRMDYEKGSHPLHPVGKPVKLSPPSYMAIDLNTKRLPKRLTCEQSLYFAYLALVDRDFEAAKGYIDSAAKGDSKGDLKLCLDLICNWCAENVSEKEPPKGTITDALALRAMLIIYDKMQFNAQSSTGLHYSQVDKLFDSYLHNRNNAVSYRLTDVEEKNLLQHLFAHGPLSIRNFARLTRLQSGKPLEEEILMPKKRETFSEHIWDKIDWVQGTSTVSKWLRACKNPWDGAQALKKGLLTRPSEHFVPFLLDCCLNFEKWSQEPFKTKVTDQLLIMRPDLCKGSNLMRDCLEKIFEYPLFFKTCLQELLDVKEQSVKNSGWTGSLIDGWFDKLLKRYQENISEFPPIKKVAAKQKLALDLPAISKHKKTIHLEEVKEPRPLLSSCTVQDLFQSTELVLQGRIPPLKLVPGNHAANSQIEKMNAQLDAFYTEREKNPQVKFSLKQTPETINEILHKEESEAKKSLSDLKTEILKSANAPLHGFYYEKQAAGGHKTHVTMDELITQFLQNDCKQFKDQIFLYLQHSTRRNQLKRSIKIVDNIILYKNYVENDVRVKNVYYPSKEDAALLISDYEGLLAKEMLAEASYKLHENPEYLVIEHYANICLRPCQIQTLKLLISGKHVDHKIVNELIAHLTMGMGKTSVLLPLLALIIANGQNMPMVIVPHALLEINKHGLARTSLRLGQRPFLIDFHRNSSIAPVDLRFLLQSMQNCIVDKSYIIASPSSLKCLALKYRELVFAEKNQAHDLGNRQESFELLRAIQKLIKGHGIYLLDEADTTLEARKSEVNFPIGKPKEISEERIVVEKILLDILLGKKFEQQVSLCENKQRDMEDKILEKVREAFVDDILNIYAPLEKDSLRPYFLGKDQLIPNVKNHPHEKILKQAYKVASTLLALVLRKNGNTHYGRSKESLKRYSIPYVGNNCPDERSEFGHVDEVMLYSAFIYAQEGLKPYDVDYLIQEMLRKVRMEAKASHIPFQNTVAYDTCVKYFNIKNIFNVTSVDKKLIAESVKDRDTLMYWLNNFVHPDIKIYSQKISMGSLGFVDMAKRGCGFTGTRWNMLAYHKRLRHPELEETIDRPEDDIAILDAIWRNVEGEGNGIHEIDSSTPLDYLEAIMKIPDLTCLLDIGAIMKGIPNKETAETIQKLIDKESPLKGTLYFDEQNRIVIHCVGSEPITIDSLEKFNYFDQVHTTGMDIKQSPRAKAVLTFSHNTVRDFTQGAMRMRQLLSSQTIELVIPKATAKKIKSEGDLTFNDLLTDAIISQSSRLADDIDYITRKELGHISSQKLFDLMLTCESIKDAAKIVEKFETLLSDITMDSATFRVLKPTLQTLKDLRDLQIAKVNALFETIGDLPEMLLNKIIPLKAEIIDELVNFEFPDALLLPAMRAETEGEEALESCVEIEKEVEVNEESQKEKLREARYHSWIGERHTLAHKPDFLSLGAHHEYGPKVIALKDVFESSKDLIKFEGLFDEALRTTRTFVITTYGQKDLAFVKDAQKRCYQLVFVKENSTISALMVDPIESGWIRRMVPMNAQKLAIEKRNDWAWDKSKLEHEEPYPHQVYLLDLENGFEEMIGPEFNGKDFERVLELTVQAKFYNGYLAYSNEEWDYLKHWITEDKAPLMRELFEKSINAQPGAYKFYESSAMRQFLQQTKRKGSL